MGKHDEQHGLDTTEDDTEDGIEADVEAGGAARAATQSGGRVVEPTMDTDWASD